MDVLKVNSLIRQAREHGVLLFVECGTVFCFPRKNLPGYLRDAIRSHHAEVRELLIQAAL